MSNILIVEDEGSSARALGSFLAAEGYEVRTAVQASEALEISRSFTPDLLLTDLLLAGHRDGLHLAEALREERPGLAVILMSGLPEHDIEKRVREVEVFAFHAKPLRLTAILRSVRRALEPNGTGRGD